MHPNPLNNDLELVQLVLQWRQRRWGWGDHYSQWEEKQPKVVGEMIQLTESHHIGAEFLKGFHDFALAFDFQSWLPVWKERGVVGPNPLGI